MRIRSAEARRRLHAFDSLLANVSAIEYDSRRIPAIHYDRLNQQYRGAVELAKLILRSLAFEHRHGAVQSSSFLLNMNEVFENFVVVSLREALSLSQRQFPQGASGRRIYLDEGGRIPIRPDLSWWDGPICTFVGDAKYKRATDSGGEHADLYQLLGYTTATDLPCGVLIYATGVGDAVTHRIGRAGKDLEVVTLDLSGSPCGILRQIRDLAVHVRGWRNRALVAKGIC